jgi:selenocysteine-specific elongation factor
MKHIIVGTAGHIDHGKTALVKALTGIDADRLKEEKERGITIDIGFAFLTVGDMRFGFVDVPGHERFVKNMLAGVHGIDLVMLVVAGDESVMPQTREHFDICKLLKVKSGLVVITKTDLVDAEMRELVEAEVHDFVAGSFLDRAPVVQVSSRTGEGIDELKNVLARLAERVEEKRFEAVPRLPVDRVFTIKGFGTVVTGTLVAGRFNVGDEIEVLSKRVRATIRGLQVHGQSVGTAQAGERTAINLQGVAVDELGRGDVVVPKGRFVPTSMIDARLELLPTSPQIVTTRTRVRFHLGTAEILARVVMLDRKELKPGENGLVQLRLETSAFVLPGERFIVRRYSPPITIAGGEVIDALPEKHRMFRETMPLDERPPLVGTLLELERGGFGERLQIWTHLSGSRGVSYDQLAARSGLTDRQLKELLKKLVADGRVIELAAQSPQFISTPTFAELKTTVRRLLEEFHRANPLAEGMPRGELRKRILGDSPEEVSHALLARLCQDREFRAEKEIVRLASHQITLSAGDAEAELRLTAAFRTAGLQPPTLEEAATKLNIKLDLAKKLQQLLVNRGVLVRVGEHLFDAQAVNSLIERIRGYKSVSQKIDVAAFKEITGVTRKYAIPLLEHLDRLHVTQRVGNDRVIL